MTRRVTPTFDGVTFDFCGRVVLVTGGSRGIGFEIASRFLMAGASVAITGRKPDALAEAVASLGTPDKVLSLQGDVGDEDHPAAAVSATIARFGSVDVLVNNAASSPYVGPVVDAPAELVRRAFDRNVVGPLLFAREAWHQGMSSSGGVIVNIGSAGGERVRHGLGPYNASKAALSHLTRQLALELAPRVRVGCVIPGLVATEFSRPLYDGREEALGRELPVGRLGRPEDVAYATLMLASPAAGWLTGLGVVVDGGASLLAGSRSAPGQGEAA